MAKFETYGISTDEMFSPGYVSFDCAIWDVPDNTIGQTGKHVVYRPLVTQEGYAGHEVVTERMRDGVKAHYAAQRAAGAQDEKTTREAASAKHKVIMDAVAVIQALPEAAKAEMDLAKQNHARHWRGINEGGEGYVPAIGWHTEIGKQIAARHGLDTEKLARAGKLLAG